MPTARRSPTSARPPRASSRALLDPSWKVEIEVEAVLAVKQVIPPSITGLVDAPAASVVDHKFGAGDPYTLGVEEEYMLLDPESFDLVQHIETVLDAVQGDELADRINAELMQSVLEIATPVCTTAGDVMRELPPFAATCATSHATRAFASARRERIRSACSSASGSPRGTATTP